MSPAKILRYVKLGPFTIPLFMPDEIFIWEAISINRLYSKTLSGYECGATLQLNKKDVACGRVSSEYHYPLKYPYIDAAKVKLSSRALFAYAEFQEYKLNEDQGITQNKISVV